MPVLPVLPASARSVIGAWSAWRRTHAGVILIGLAALGGAGAVLVAVGPAPADGALSVLSGLLLTGSLTGLASRALPPPDWRFGALLGVAALATLTAWFWLDWDAASAPSYLLLALLLSLEPRSPDRPDHPRWRGEAARQERLEKLRAREARIRRDHPEEFQPVPWGKVE